MTKCIFFPINFQLFGNTQFVCEKKMQHSTCHRLIWKLLHHAIPNKLRFQTCMTKITPIVIWTKNLSNDSIIEWFHFLSLLRPSIFHFLLHSFHFSIVLIEFKINISIYLNVFYKSSVAKERKTYENKCIMMKWLRLFYGHFLFRLIDLIVFFSIFFFSPF